MPVVICMLRGVNVGGRNKIKMDQLRALCVPLKLRDAVTHLQSGNLVFRAAERNLAALEKKLEHTIEKSFGFRCAAILRTPAEMKDAISRNPFQGRELDPSKVLVYFLRAEPSPEARAKAALVPSEPEELHIHARELFIYFPNGMARPKLSMPAVERALQTAGTGRNWNTVTRLLEIAESLNA